MNSVYFPKLLILVLGILIGISIIIIAPSDFGSGHFLQWFENPFSRNTPTPTPRTREPIDIQIRDRDQISLFILAGQSNMSGRGTEFASNPKDPRILVFGNDYRWYIASEPIDEAHNQVDQVSEDIDAGYSPSMAFASTLLERNPKMMIGLIPCAKGASTISEWQRNLSERSLYGSCLKRARAASTVGRIAGLLIFQGEQDAADATQNPNQNIQPALWPDLFAAFVNDFRLDLPAPDLPVVYAQIGKTTTPTAFPNWELVKYMQQLTDLPNTAMIVTDDLRLMDNVHFTTDSYQIIGTRFAEAYWELVEEQ